MARNYFRKGELPAKDEKFEVKLIHEFYKPVEEVEEEKEEPVYEGPTAEDLKREAEAFKVEWEAEKQKMLADAQAQADDIIKRAQDSAFSEVKRQTDQAQVLKNDAENEAKEILRKAQEEAESLRAKTAADTDGVNKNAYKEGFDKGREDGFKAGREEVSRLIERTHKILEAVMARREEILSETEQQIVELVVLMTRKVVKLISENQKSVVMANVLQALKKVKGRGDVTLRVNFSDVKLTTEHIQDFIKQVENVKGITVVEDSTVDKGGCVVETDFGAIDARISSQLSELETKILEISPVKSLAKSDSVAEV